MTRASKEARTADRWVGANARRHAEDVRLNLSESTGRPCMVYVYEIGLGERRWFAGRAMQHAQAKARRWQRMTGVQFLGGLR